MIDGIVVNASRKRTERERGGGVKEKKEGTMKSLKKKGVVGVIIFNDYVARS